MPCYTLASPAASSATVGDQVDVRWPPCAGEPPGSGQGAGKVSARTRGAGVKIPSHVYLPGTAATDRKPRDQSEGLGPGQGHRLGPVRHFPRHRLGFSGSQVALTPGPPGRARDGTTRQGMRRQDESGPARGRRSRSPGSRPSAGIGVRSVAISVGTISGGDIPASECCRRWTTRQPTPRPTKITVPTPSVSGSGGQAQGMYWRNRPLVFSFDPRW
jgi:hypothetical protein